ELMESVLEISTDPCANTVEAGEQLRALRRQVNEAAARKDLVIGSAGTHPFAMWEDQRIVARPRYRDLISALRFVARQEIIFGQHALALAALIQAMVKELAEHYEAGEHLTDYPWQMLDENKWLAARHGLDGEIVDLPSSERVGTRALAKRLLDRLRGHAQDLGSAAELEGIQDLI